MLDRLRLYAQTARYLRTSQGVYFLMRRMQRARPAGNYPLQLLDGERLAALAPIAKALRGCGDAAALARAQDVLRDRFVFLNHAEVLDKIDWKRDYAGRLWIYNLHYFDYATDLAQAYLATHDRAFVDRLEALVTDWVTATKEGKGVAWDPYPVSVRIVNWIFALLLLDDVIRDEVKVAMAQSLSRQLSHLERRLEWHLLANHLQKNLVALFIGGLVFGGSTAERWRRKGARLLWAQVDLQVLPDGVHAERSPMYHAIALNDLLELVALARAVAENIPHNTLARIGALASALVPLTRGDGSLHLVNDAAQGVAPDPGRLGSLAQNVLGVSTRTVQGRWALPAGGFYGYRDEKKGDSLLIDCGNPGPSYQPGHAHCGILGYELDIAGLAVVVDSGVHGYDRDPFREYVRSTRAHNTVSINGREQSEVWGTFRFGRRARVISAVQRMENGAYVFEGAYRPYHDSASVHERRLVRTVDYVEITDTVRSRGQRLQSFVHFHPDCRIERQSDALVAHRGVVSFRIDWFGVDSVALHKAERAPVQGWYCPEFGKAMPQTVLAMQLQDNNGDSFGYRITVVSRQT